MSISEHLPAALRTRIAPTPSGYLHLGNGASFLLTAQLAKAVGGGLLLRIDDLDAERTRPEYVEDILATLRWLDIEWQEGPKNAGEFRAQWSQTLRAGRYAEAIAALQAQGLLYACACSRKDLAARGSQGRYDGHCRTRNIPLEQPGTALRLRLPDACEPHYKKPDGIGSIDLVAMMGDPIIRQRNGQAAYQVASLVDDVDFGINVIVRGADLLASTACQVHLATLLEHRSFMDVVFIHHPLLTDGNGNKLSKSEGADALRSLREVEGGRQVVEQHASMLMQAIGSGGGPPRP